MGIMGVEGRCSGGQARTASAKSLNVPFIVFPFQVPLFYIGNGAFLTERHAAFGGKNLRNKGELVDKGALGGYDRYV